jgi:hypothetical protein
MQAGCNRLSCERRRVGVPGALRGFVMRFIFRIAIVVGATGLLAAGCGGSAGQSSAPSAPAPAAPASPSPASAPAVPASARPPALGPAQLGYQPLYPFASFADVHLWQGSYRTGGHQPWHLSADQTALSFTQGYLGFTDITKVARHTVGADDARVTVGLALPNGKVSDAATIHLVRWGAGQQAPWEVVGTDDTTLTLDVPVYGSALSSPVAVRGTITGVDESLRAEVRTLGSAAPAGTFCCTAAGGSARPFSLSVRFRAPSGRVVTIVVHTGGHVAAVERFAVTGAAVR